MLERKRRIVLRICSKSSKLELDVHTGSSQNVPASSVTLSETHTPYHLERWGGEGGVSTLCMMSNVAEPVLFRPAPAPAPALTTSRLSTVNLHTGSDQNVPAPTKISQLRNTDICYGDLLCDLMLFNGHKMAESGLNPFTICLSENKCKQFGILLGLPRRAARCERNSIFSRPL